MELTHTRLDLAAYDGSFNPHAIVDRHKGETWYVPSEPVTMDRLQWHVCRKENHVYLPIFPYVTPPEPDLAMAFMFQLATRVMVATRQLDIKRLHLVTGVPVHELVSSGSDTRWQIQLGFGLVT